MRRAWRMLMIAAVVAAGMAIYFEVRASKLRRREAAYEAAAHAYARDFPAGMTRKQVEERLRGRGDGFAQNNLWKGGRTFGMIRLGEEDGGWYCRSLQVYVAFEFEHDPAELVPQARETDVLKAVTLQKQPEGCF